MAQIQQPQPPDQFGLPQAFTPRVQPTPQLPPPYYGFEPPKPVPSISQYNPTFGTALLEKMWQTVTGNFPGAGAVPQAGTTMFPHYSKLEQALMTRMPKQAPAEQVRGIIGKGGVKPEEVEYSGVEDYLSKAPLASKEGLMQHIQQTRPKLEVQQRGGNFDKARYSYLRDNEYILDEAGKAELKKMEEAGGSLKTKFEQYTLPGGENYRELLVTMPERPEKLSGTSMEGEPVYKYGESPSFTSSHFDEPNVLTHLRVNDRVTPDGKKVLFVEEVQSDWHQKGRQQGYRGQRIGRSEKEVTEQLDAIIDKHESRFGPQDPNVLYKTNPEYRRLRDELDAVTQESRKLGNQVPDAPFKKSWPLLAMKQALSEAARDGKDYVAWTTGAQQAERYDLSKQLDAVNVGRHSDGKYFIEGIRGDETLLRKGGLGEEQLAEHIGKDLAKRAAQDLQKMEGGAYKSYAGVDLKVGGEGMVSFYDKELVNELNKYAKQWGVKVEQIPMKFGEDYVTIEQSGGGYIVREKGGEGERFFEMRSAAKEYAAELAKQNKTYNADRAWALPITPRMREEILGTGQPLFSLGAGLAGGVLAEKLAQPREQTFEQKETASHLTRMGKDVY